jgi:hypothetical protein
MLGARKGGDFYADPLVGFRTWRMDLAKLELTGVVYPTAVWPAIEDASAVCLHPGDHQHLPNHVPVKECMCGFYGYWDYQQVRDSMSCGFEPISTVRGVSIGWGKVWTAERGFRAKHARPVALLHWGERRNTVRQPFTEKDYEKAFEWNEMTEKIAAKYSVPIVHSPEELGEAARQYLR